MKLFGWNIERATEVHNCNMRWFMRGHEAGWRAAMDEAEAEIKKHGITVLRVSPEIKAKFNLSVVK